VYDVEEMISNTGGGGGGGGGVRIVKGTNGELFGTMAIEKSLYGLKGETGRREG